MTDSASFNKALVKRKQLIRELEHLSIYQELICLDAFIKTYYELEGATRIRRRESQPDAAAAICIEEDGPIPTRELVPLLEARGRSVRGKNLITNLSSVLSRDPRFENVPGRGWQLI